ncbi:hypothetical protein BLNAU_2655 [Blattamonas nauphoetae]|uniref:Uncharacterized protein n=1 Tax=Blattamonas nauphoetae TaxID=2049346 RepID=A0ABQ9YF69_9EUKA|nr:hypothetical protein BLNAU_2655 [Blattamonas nauphoetae]
MSHLQEVTRDNDVPKKFAHLMKAYSAIQHGKHYYKGGLSRPASEIEKAKKDKSKPLEIRSNETLSMFNARIQRETANDILETERRKTRRFKKGREYFQTKKDKKKHKNAGDKEEIGENGRPVTHLVTPIERQWTIALPDEVDPLSLLNLTGKSKRRAEQILRKQNQTTDKKRPPKNPLSNLALNEDEKLKVDALVAEITERGGGGKRGGGATIGGTSDAPKSRAMKRIKREQESLHQLSDQRIKDKEVTSEGKTKKKNQAANKHDERYAADGVNRQMAQPPKLSALARSQTSSTTAGQSSAVKAQVSQDVLNRIRMQEAGLAGDDGSDVDESSEEDDNSSGDVDSGAERDSDESNSNEEQESDEEGGSSDSLSENSSLESMDLSDLSEVEAEIVKQKRIEPDAENPFAQPSAKKSYLLENMLGETESIETKTMRTEQGAVLVTASSFDGVPGLKQGKAMEKSEKKRRDPLIDLPQTVQDGVIVPYFKQNTKVQAMRRKRGKGKEDASESESMSEEKKDAVVSVREGRNVWDVGRVVLKGLTEAEIGGQSEDDEYLEERKKERRRAQKEEMDEKAKKDAKKKRRRIQERMMKGKAPKKLAGPEFD